MDLKHSYSYECILLLLRLFYDREMTLHFHLLVIFLNIHTYCTTAWKLEIICISVCFIEQTVERKQQEIPAAFSAFTSYKDVPLINLSFWHILRVY
jgi:hypothetical protein